MRVHISLNVSSLDKSTGFYRQMFGQAASKTKAGYANFRLDQPPIHLALVEAGKSGSEGVSHLGIELPDAGTLDEWHSRLTAAGVDFEVEDKANCCFALADKLWLTDPDGYRWEIWVRTGEYDGIGASRISAEQRPDDSNSCCPQA